MNAPFPTPAAKIAWPSSATPIIRLKSVTKTFSGRASQEAVQALNGIDLDVAPGAIVGVIGRSGAGKSTLIRLINGLETATGGTIVVDGVDVTGLSEAGWRKTRRSIGMIFQHFNLLSSRTVYDNVALPLEIAGADRDTIRDKVTGLLDLVGLADKRGRYPSELSGGQKQRVGIARALATDPKVLLCDEATSALDPETTRSILGLLARVNRELGVTILLITHEIPVIKEICHRVAVIDTGRIVEQGDVFEVFTRPQHPTTASFVAGITGVELPREIASRLRPNLIEGGNAIIRIGFIGQNATAPVISRLTTTLGVDVNIIAGRIDTIGSKPFGCLIVAVPAAEPAKSAVLGALSTLDLTAEVLGYVP